MSTVTLVIHATDGSRFEAILEPRRRRRGVVITHYPAGTTDTGNQERPLATPTHPQ